MWTGFDGSKRRCHIEWRYRMYGSRAQMTVSERDGRLTQTRLQSLENRGGPNARPSRYRPQTLDPSSA